MRVKEIDLGYTPRLWQARMHCQLKRFNVLVFHRRGGKTYFSLREMVDQGLRCVLHNPQYAYVAPTYGQAKRVAWEYLKDFCKNLPGVNINEAELRVDVPRPDRGDKIRFILLGAENPDSLAGIYLDGVILDEYSLMNPVVWSTLIRPALSDRKGWAIFIGTPRGQNHFYDQYQIAQENETGNWFCALFKASETGIVPDEELEAAKLEMSEDEYMQEFECSFTAALVGAYYSKDMALLEEKGQITNVPYDKNLPVCTYWDLGIGDTTAIWFIQELGNTEIHVIDYVERAGIGLDEYARILKSKPYLYEEHYIPHDGAARELGTGKTRQETLREFGINTRIVERQSIADGIHAVRMILNKCWFDRENCKDGPKRDGIKSLKNYEREYDNKNKIFKDKPKHNWASNGADAFRQFALVYMPGRRERVKKLPRRAKRDYYALR